MKKCLVWMVLLLGSPTLASADVLLNETFSYGNGNLVGNGGWGAHSGAGSQPVQVDAGAIVLNQGSGSREDVSVDLGQVMGAGDIWRFEFDVSVSGTAAAQNVYFAHFKNAGTGTAFNARLFITAPTAGGDFTFGIGETASTPSTTFNSAFNYGTTYRVFAEYNYDLGYSELWIDSRTNGVIDSSGDPDTLQLMSMMAFRQAGGNTSMRIDNLTVTAVPEPTSFGTLMLVGIGLAFARRRR